MQKLIFHSFKGGPGKTTILANLAVTLALQGKRVAIMDMDLGGTGLHVLFQLKKRAVKHTLNDFLLGICSTKDVIIDLTPSLNIKDGKLILLPASYKIADMVKIVKQGYELFRLTQAVEEISKANPLDYILIDTKPGIDEATLLSLAISNTALIISTADEQNIVGTGVVLEIARALKKESYLILNMIPPSLPKEAIKRRLENLFKVPVISAMPFYPDVLSARSRQLFVLKYPKHGFSQDMKSLASTIAKI